MSDGTIPSPAVAFVATDSCNTFEKVDSFHAYLPYLWAGGDSGGDGMNGPAVVDAGTIYLVGDSDTGHSEVIARTTVDELAKDVIDGLLNHVANKITDTEGKEVAMAIAKAMRDAASLLESFCE